MSRRVRVVVLPRFRVTGQPVEPARERDYEVEYDEDHRSRMCRAVIELRYENVEVRALLLGLRAYLSHLAYGYVFVRDVFAEVAVLTCMSTNRDVRDEFLGCDVLLAPWLGDDEVRAVAGEGVLWHAVTERMEREDVPGQVAK